MRDTGATYTEATGFPQGPGSLGREYRGGKDICGQNVICIVLSISLLHTDRSWPFFERLSYLPSACGRDTRAQESGAEAQRPSLCQLLFSVDWEGVMEGRGHKLCPPYSGTSNPPPPMASQRLAGARAEELQVRG